jgi:glucose-6-phosphate dehydrogenase assembly protein OpcA
MVALHRRDTAELLAEELRRLDPDEVYAETLGSIDAVTEEPAAAVASADDAVSMDEVVDDIEDLENLAEGE